MLHTLNGRRTKRTVAVLLLSKLWLCDVFGEKKEIKQQFQNTLANYLGKLMSKTQPENQDKEIQNWLGLAAFILRNRNIELNQRLTNN